MCGRRLDHTDVSLGTWTSTGALAIEPGVCASAFGTISTIRLPAWMWSMYRMNSGSPEFVRSRPRRLTKISLPASITIRGSTPTPPVAIRYRMRSTSSGSDSLPVEPAGVNTSS